MARLSEIRKRFEFLRDNAESVAEQVLDRLEEVIVQEQKDQLYRGETNRGGHFDSYSSDIYAEYKHNMNPAPGPFNPDLYKTGAFYRGIVARIEGGRVVLTSTDSKTAKIEGQYGARFIWGLNADTRRDLLQRHLRPAAMQALKNILQL